MLRYGKIALRSVHRYRFETRRFNHNDPLGLKAILREVRESEAPKTTEKPSSSLDELLSQITEDVKPEGSIAGEGVYTKTENIHEDKKSTPATKFSEVNDFEELSGFLDSLQTTGLSSTDKVRADEKTGPDVILQEQALFRDAFESLIKESDKRNNRKKNYGNIIDYTKGRADSELSTEETARLVQSLQKSLDHIRNIPTEQELTASLNNLLSDTTKLIEKANKNKTVRSQLLVKDMDFTEVLENAKKTSEETPVSPLLNVLTLPVLFKEYLHTSSYKFKNGQLTLSYFNHLKDKLHLYLTVCNQSTYNEILKTIWVFYGKLSLHSVEAVVTDMESNGFSGDFITFNILKEIILDYYSLKMGDFKPAHNILPIWTTEDDERVSRLENKLRTISKRIRSAPI